ncbi:hypothetical protein FFLO_05324 [Filobasidium floriforme]|uniref:FAD/NAD(P)-binding domain-containing protein n=1 Tax=Filobasidium floriforme TaxID=5210 RepID=A0A8K0JML5_9TREE|nr:hypothetical protein FFLO_05324 [Filobasidium floriforme]
MPVPAPLKTVLVLGSAYAGNRSVEVLAKSLPLNWRIVVIDRSTHFCHIYAFPRVSILPGHEQKVFIPFTTMFTRGLDEAQKAHVGRHHLIHGTVTGLGEREVRYTPFVPKKILLNGGNTKEERKEDEVPEELHEGPEETLSFDYCIYALGAKYPSPINVWTHQSTIFSHEPASLQNLIATRTEAGEAHEINKTPVGDKGGRGVVETTECTGTKKEGISWMRAAQRRIEEVERILVVGGGALGVQMATDIIATHGQTKKVTLLHSRPNLLNRFDIALHEAAMKRMEEFGIEVILGSRVDGSFINKTEGGKVRTTDGREVEADLILWCTGQSPNTSYIQKTYPSAINPTNSLAYVNRYLQLSTLKPEAVRPDPKVDGPNELKNEDFEVLNERVFVTGDCADAFGALNAGHTAYWQADMAAENVLSLIKAEENVSLASQTPVELKEYKPPAYGIKVSLGRDLSIYQRDGKFGIGDPIYNQDDLGTGIMWSSKELSEDDYFA